MLTDRAEPKPQLNAPDVDQVAIAQDSLLDKLPIDGCVRARTRLQTYPVRRDNLNPEVSVPDSVLFKAEITR